MTAPRWQKQDDNSLTCISHGENFRPPASCPKCVADPGPPPAETPLVVTFPDGCKTDEQAWEELSSDAAKLDNELAFYRRVRRRIYGKKSAKVRDGDEAGRADSEVVLTGEVIGQLATIANVIVKLQDAKTKTLRAVIETSHAYRRDARTQQMLEAKLRKLKAKRGAGR